MFAAVLIEADRIAAGVDTVDLGAVGAVGIERLEPAGGTPDEAVRRTALPPVVTGDVTPVVDAVNLHKGRARRIDVGDRSVGRPQESVILISNVVHTGDRSFVVDDGRQGVARTRNIDIRDLSAAVADETV